MNTADLPKTKLEAIRYFADEEKAHAFLVDMRWPEGVRCAHCQSERVGNMTVSGKRRLWNCKECKRQFTAKVNTIFQDSPRQAVGVKQSKNKKAATAGSDDGPPFGIPPVTRGCSGCNPLAMTTQVSRMDSAPLRRSLGNPVRWGNL